MCILHLCLNHPCVFRFDICGRMITKTRAFLGVTIIYSVPVKSVSNIYAKISVYEIKIGTLNVPLLFHQQIMVMNDSQGELVPTITQILVRMVI